MSVAQPLCTANASRISLGESQLRDPCTGASPRGRSEGFQRCSQFRTFLGSREPVLDGGFAFQCSRRFQRKSF